MTDTLASSTTLNGSELNPLRPHAITDFRYPQNHVDATVEDDGQISCLCGFNEDDGNTVACDICNKWQHIRCYYPQWADGNVPDDLQHFCIDCKPRDVDSHAARVRQANARQRKELPHNAKRPASKTKKKPTLNGFPLDKRHDRTSASPREQGPPTKRPKTIHRTSNSTHQARKRSASTIQPRSVSASPETIPQTYSPEFVSAYQNDAFTTTSANCLDNLEIGAKLSDWLEDPEEVWEISNGMALSDIFQRFDGDLSIIDPPVDMIELETKHDHRVTTADGQSPMWKIATLKDPITQHACIGELRGHIGFKEDYKADPANRWSVLRHPEPFVFFHPYLPICIDARTEGTLLRYIRRSCDPNAELKVIITGSHDYHFCFIAQRDIEAGEEVAIAWDCASTMAEIVRGPKFSKDESEAVQQWISLLLSNCGPCACKRQECLMARFDKRFSDDSERPPKTKAPRRKKELQHISPLNTHAVNSRSGSEVRKFDDDERDSRSATGSGKGTGDSRDMTPNTHYSTNGHVPELSERERKKLAKEEEMFRRQEEQGRKKKRTSGGNGLDVARSASSKQSPGLPKRMDLANGRALAKTRRKSTAPKATLNKPARSVYVDTGVQCEMDAHETVAFVKQSNMLTRRRMAPLHERLLERCAQVNAIWKKSRKPPRINTSRPTDDDGDTTMEETQPQRQSMKLDMPPPPANPFVSTQPWTASTPVSMVESPAGAGPFALLSPSVQAAVTPAKKKLSLSDYTRRNKAKESEVKPDRDSSPSSTISGPVAQPVTLAEDTSMEGTLS